MLVLRAQQVLFLDDTMDHIRLAAVTCGTLHVSGNGMSAADLAAIRAAAGLPAVATEDW